MQVHEINILFHFIPIADFLPNFKIWAQDPYQTNRRENYEKSKKLEHFFRK